MTDMLTRQETTAELDYCAGLSRHQEAVISSHFMELLARDTGLQLYDETRLRCEAWTIDEAEIDALLLPILLAAARRFAEERGAAAVKRAKERYEAYGLARPDDLGEAEVVAEVMFDRQFARKANQTCSRVLLRNRFAAQLQGNRRIQMAIPALPFKIRSPLKSRGDLPDLAEVGFILSLFEIALAVEIAAGIVAPSRERPVARFVVVSDGSRFASLANMPVETIAAYRRSIQGWIGRLGLERYVILDDYRGLLERGLPQGLQAEKARIADAARSRYHKLLAPVFDPNDMKQSLERSRTIEPDPEAMNANGRFGALLRSLVYTINYRALAELDLPTAVRTRLYRELTARLFEPIGEANACFDGLTSREPLRRAMLTEVWDATIAYLAEIKSDRDLTEDPMLACLPGAIRWTIHAKVGQLALVTPSVDGTMVQPWAGAGVFRPTEKGAVRLCASPVLGLEGTGAVPVFAGAICGTVPAQPLFYVDRRIGCGSLQAFFDELGRRFTRRRLS